MKNPLRILGLKALPVAVLVVLAFAAGRVSAESDEVLTLDIKPQNAGLALVALARNSGVQIMLEKEVGAEVEVEGLKGEYRFEDALAALLANMGLTYEYASENVVLVRQAQETAEDDAAVEEPAAEDDDEPVELPEQTLTGSRLLGGDPSAQVYTFTAKDIAASGVADLEEFFRKQAWAFASISTQTSNDTLSADEAISFAGGRGVGVSTINLRGMGSANTLVLLNGRRIAGTGGQQDDFVNLLNIPLSGIERVDVQLGGASAVYGSDAIAGIVNFITKKRFRGLSATFRNEFSTTDADRTNAAVHGGYAWGSGNATVVLSRSTSEPITNEKTGWASLDFRPLMGPEFDRRENQIGQPGIACVLLRTQWRPTQLPSFGCDYRAPRYQLPADHDGVGATIDDFNTFTIAPSQPAPVPLDEIPPQNGIQSTNESVNVNVEQYLTDDLRVYADIQWSWNESYQEFDRRIRDQLLVPASNAYNPFGVAMAVSYAPIYEYENGLLPAQYDESKNESRNLTAGLIWAFGDGHQLDVAVTHSRSDRESYRLEAQARRTALDPTAEEFYAALSSPDPAKAINVFGNGTATGAAFEQFLTASQGPAKGHNETRQYSANLRGDLFRIWGGPISYALGGEHQQFFTQREFAPNYYLSTTYGPELYGAQGNVFDVGVKRPSRDVTAYYGEVALPFFGRDNARPGLGSLVLTLQARYDVHKKAGAQGGRSSEQIYVREHYWGPDEGFQYVESPSPRWRDFVDANLVTVRESRLSPRVGIRYQPSANFTVRVAWRRSFKAPIWLDVFSTYAAAPPRAYGTNPWRGVPIIDLWDPDGPTEITVDQGVTYVLKSYTEDLESEYSDNWSGGFDWNPEWLPGLRWRVDWSKVDLTNKIAFNLGWLWDNPDYVLNHPQVAVRNERGDLVQVRAGRININEQYNERISTELAYSFSTRFGDVRALLNYSRYLEDFRQATSEAPKDTKLGTAGGNDRYKWQASLNWVWGRFSADVFMHYTPAHINVTALPCWSSQLNIEGTRCTELNKSVPLPVSSLTTVDLTMSYRFVSGLTIRAGGQNVLDRDAPVTLVYNKPYDPVRWNARGQVLFLELSWDM